MAHSKLRQRPRKPRADFPLFPHAAGYWAKKVRGKLHYFGKVATDPKGQAALDKWLEQKDDLLAGRTPRLHLDELTIHHLANHFLTHKLERVESGELTRRTFAELYATCDRVLEAFGKTRLVEDLAAEDFERLRASVAKIWGPVRLGNEVQRVRSLFKYAYEASLIDKPVRFGPAFSKPNKKTMRKVRASKGKRMFEARHIRQMLKRAGVQLRAMILLGINCGFGNNDCASLPMIAVDLRSGWLDFPRPKTGIERRCPLWPETVDALKVAIDERHKPKDATHGNLLFITKHRGTWSKETSDNPVSKETTKLLKALDLHRAGLGFYALRHTFETVGGESKDQVAVDSIMGHAAGGDDMSAIYREEVSDARLLAVSEYVRRWLFRGRHAKTKTRDRSRKPLVHGKST